MKTLRVGLFTFVLSFAALAHADGKPDSEGFVPVQAGETLGPGETLPATNLVAAAYGFILFALIAWTASVAIRARRVEDELATLRKKIEK